MEGRRYRNQLGVITQRSDWIRLNGGHRTTVKGKRNLPTLALHALRHFILFFAERNRIMKNQYYVCNVNTEDGTPLVVLLVKNETEAIKLATEMIVEQERDSDDDASFALEVDDADFLKSDGYYCGQGYTVSWGVIE